MLYLSTTHYNIKQVCDRYISYSMYNQLVLLKAIAYSGHRIAT
ncbi:hypothetical protein [Nostoc sp. TCL26-01]|nr:hypothetical protein [Nostoc sp. TCL26-01]